MLNQLLNEKQLRPWKGQFEERMKASSLPVFNVFNLSMGYVLEIGSFKKP